MSATWKRAHGRPVSNWIREPVSAAAVASWPGPVWLAVQDDRLPVREALRESRHAGDGPQRARQRPGSAPIGAPPVPSPRPGVGSSVGYCPSTSRQDPGLVGFRRAGHAPRRGTAPGIPPKDLDNGCNWLPPPRRPRARPSRSGPRVPLVLPRGLLDQTGRGSRAGRAPRSAQPRLRCGPPTGA